MPGSMYIANGDSTWITGLLWTIIFMLAAALGGIAAIFYLLFQSKTFWGL